MAAEAAHPWITARATLTDLQGGRSKLIHKAVKDMQIRAQGDAFGTQMVTSVFSGAQTLKQLFGLFRDKSNLSAENCIKPIWDTCRNESGCNPSLYFPDKNGNKRWQQFNVDWNDDGEHRDLWWGRGKYKGKDPAEFKCDKSGMPGDFRCSKKTSPTVLCLQM